MEEVLRIVSAGGTPLLLVIGYILWKFDRRLVRIETTLNNHLRHLEEGEEGREDDHRR